MNFYCENINIKEKKLNLQMKTKVVAKTRKMQKCLKIKTINFEFNK